MTRQLRILVLSLGLFTLPANIFAARPEEDSDRKKNDEIISSAESNCECEVCRPDRRHNEVADPNQPYIGLIFAALTMTFSYLVL